nr:PRA1 family protein H [Ipomoea batatas]
MVFSANPLSLSVPEPAFETWLRDSGYLEIVDQRTSDLHRLSSSSAAAATSSSSSAAAPSTTASSAISNGFFVSFFSNVGTLLSLFTFNPFSKLAPSDFSGDTPSWTLKFFGSCESYSFPSSPAQARLRVHENVKRYARNYASLFILIFACSLYQMPLALVGLLSCLALWDLLKLCGGRFGLDQYPTTKLILICIAQCATAAILFGSNVHSAFLCAVGVSYAVMILHASFRKLTPSKQSTQRDGNKRVIIK